MPAQTLPTTLAEQLYYQMLRIRLVEEKIADLYPQQEMRCPVHLCIGQEAVSAGVCVHLRKEDLVMSGHRAHGHYLAKGGSLKGILAEIYGKATGCAAGRGGSMHLIDLSVNFVGSTPIVASTVPVATGVAFAEAYNRKDTVTVAFLGEGAMEEGVVHESLNFARLKKLPIIYVCENNFFSVYTPLAERQPSRPVYQLAQGHGIAAFQEDGNDVLKVEALMRKAVEIVKTQGGPVFLEFITYRWREHCGPNYDNHIGYRSPEEFEQWKVKCPLAQFERRVKSEGLIPVDTMSAMRADIEQEIAEALEFVRKSPFPTQPVTGNDVYAD